MRAGHLEAKFVHRDEQRGRVGAARNRNEHAASRPDEPARLDGLEERVGGCRLQHGGAGWTRTSDNAIMSRALYHLSYGTAQARRKPGALSGEDPILRFARAPSACASSPVAWPAPLAFSCSSLLQKNQAEPSTYGAMVGSRMVAEVGFEPTTFGLASRRAPPAPLRSPSV